MYGFTSIMGFHCICLGRKAIFYKIGWPKNRIRTYTGKVTTEDVLRNINNGSKRFRFFGFMSMRGYHVYIEKKGEQND